MGWTAISRERQELVEPLQSDESRYQAAGAEAEPGIDNEPTPFVLDMFQERFPFTLEQTAVFQAVRIGAVAQAPDSMSDRFSGEVE